MDARANREKVFERASFNSKNYDQIAEDVQAEVIDFPGTRFMEQAERNQAEMKFHNKFVLGARSEQRRLAKKLKELQSDQKKNLGTGPVSAGESKKKTSKTLVNSF